MDDEIEDDECLEEEQFSMSDLRDTIKSMLEMTRDNPMDVKTIEYTVIVNGVQKTIKMEFE